MFSHLQLRSRRALLIGALIGVITTLFVIVVLRDAPPLVRADLASYDFALQHRPSPLKPSQVVFVGVDNTSISDLANGQYPLPRRLIAHAVDFLHRAGARAIGLDFLYARPTGDDAALAAAIRRAGNVVVANALESGDQSSYLGGELQLLDPVDPIAQAARLGLANVDQDRDSVIRRAATQYAGPGGSSALGNHTYPTFAVMLAATALRETPAQVARRVPEHFYINYAGPQTIGQAGQQSIPAYQFEGVASAPYDDPALFKNKVVIIGCAALMCVDQHATPYGEMFGPVVQANITETILQRSAIIGLDTPGQNALILLIGLLMTLIAVTFGIWVTTVAALALGSGYAFGSILLVDLGHRWAPIVAPEVTIVLVYAGIMAFRFATEERQKRHTRRVFGEYVKPEIVELLVDNAAVLNPVRRAISVLFVDIRGFTSMSEQLEPEAVVAILDIYLEALTESVQQFDGTLDKYVGDELMAIWNAPHDQPNHALRAIQCALDMVARMESINTRLTEQGFPTISYGVGVSSGEAVVGRMGSSLRKQYTVIGDTVNTGARLCSAAQGGQILVPESCSLHLGVYLDTVPTEPLHLKGKSQPLRTVQVLGIIDNRMPLADSAIDDKPQAGSSFPTANPTD